MAPDTRLADARHITAMVSVLQHCDTILRQAANVNPVLYCSLIEVVYLRHILIYFRVSEKQFHKKVSLVGNGRSPYVTTFGRLYLLLYKIMSLRQTRLPC